MIQQTNARQPNTTISPPQQTISDGPETRAQWVGRRHYSLEVVQHPLRARMCGFGDKDRRPLAPAAVAKMVVRGEDHNVIDVDDVDCSFFLVTVDLWSGDGKREMNLVLHPSSADRYVPPNAAKQRRRGTSSSAPQSRPSGNQTPAMRSTPTPQFRSDQVRPSTGTTTPIMPQTPVYSSSSNPQGYFQSQGSPDGMPPSYGSATSETTSWGYPGQAPPVDRNTTYPPPILPSIHSLGRNSATPASNSSEAWQSEGESEILPYRAWNPDASYTPVENFPNTSVDNSIRASSSTDGRESSTWPQSEQGSTQSRYSQEGYSGPNQVDQSMYASASYAQHSGQEYYTSPYPPSAPGAGGHASGIPLARHTYTRTLVGPLSANACRLLDEHRKPGIFFLFQDLSVRTEGTFRLRLRLMNVGAPPAPERGAVRVHTDVSPVLAQTFTEPFIVFSAKRFPGVPATTALSIAFGNQGQKLPLVRFPPGVLIPVLTRS
ncbi:hypothetical protein BDN72DRAFT_950568 [Pluteus cervinus]|uniref:Uncharacterized protein n=1 Tax=Pluteus cervinus TaxID=181527 RepID=A0ACD3AQF7_9AGAR|nr:hypothetical protein BDN72DRAFT_950568 [Pluteus cervinus]